MKVLLINYFDSGGAARACIRLHQGLLKNGIESKILFCVRKNKDIPETFAFNEGVDLSPFGSLLNRTRKYFFKKNKDYQLRNLPKGYELFQFPISTFDIINHPLYEWADIINFHWVANFLDWPSFFKKNIKPLVWTLHDMLPFTGGYHYEIGFPLLAYARLIKKNLAIKTKVLEKQNIQVVAPSNWMYEKSSKSDLFGNFSHTIIPYGINSEIFKPSNKILARKHFDLPVDKKIVLFVADDTNNKRKGFEYLKDAIELLDENLVLVVIGNNIPKFEKYPNIRKMGYIREDQILALAYVAVDLFVIPSIEDNLPNTILESLLCGTPVVGFNIGGVPEIIIQGKNGILCQNISAENLANSIFNALEIPFQKKWIRANAQERFDEFVQARNYIKLFENTIDHFADSTN